MNLDKNSAGAGEVPREASAQDREEGAQTMVSLRINKDGAVFYTFYEDGQPKEERLSESFNIGFSVSNAKLRFMSDKPFRIRP